MAAGCTHCVFTFKREKRWEGIESSSRQWRVIAIPVVLLRWLRAWIDRSNPEKKRFKDPQDFSLCPRCDLRRKCT
eukprot:scaffold108445_cov42-Attheya_sp.AAC.2